VYLYFPESQQSDFFLTEQPFYQPWKSRDFVPMPPAGPVANLLRSVPDLVELRRDAQTHPRKHLFFHQ